MTKLLYKYLDVDGAISMIVNKELQFTNPCYFNDPFDCHPGLFNTSNPPEKPNNWPPQDFLIAKADTDLENMRSNSWVSCLSKTCDNLLLWSYYNNHRGVCVGLDQDMLDQSLSGDLGLICNALRFEVSYRKVLEERPNYFKSEQGALRYLLTSKGEEWKHEQEVRYCIYKPHPWLPCGLNRTVNDGEMVDNKEVRYYPHIDPLCFKRIYIGCKISVKDMTRIMEAAETLPHDIEIYQMEIDPAQFRVIPKRIR